jgi:hypothetical protein
MMHLAVGGVSVLSRTSAGELNIASYHPRSSPTWHWSLTLIKSEGKPHRAERRTGQWHDYYWLPFGYRLLVSRQDYHLSSGGQ